MKSRNIIVLSLVAMVSFSYGFTSMKFHLPPYHIVKNIFCGVYLDLADRNSLGAKNLCVAKVVGTIQKISSANLSKRLSNVTVNAVELRKSLVDKVVLPPELISLTKERLNASEVEINTKMYGITHKSVLSTSGNTNSSCLRIYIEGHGGNPFNFDAHNELRQSSIESGCDFLSMSMLGIGLNEGEASFPGNRYGENTIKLNLAAAKFHGNYLLYLDKNFIEHDPLSLFLTPHFYVISSLLGEYENATLMGISGGGWYTVWLGALLPGIDSSIIYAGSMPFEYRSKERHVGHLEDFYSSIYKDIGYWELYILALYDKVGGQNRSVYFVYNNDVARGIYTIPDASHFQSVVESLDINNFKVIIDYNNDQHAWSVPLVKSIW